MPFGLCAMGGRHEIRCASHRAEAPPGKRSARAHTPGTAGSAPDVRPRPETRARTRIAREWPRLRVPIGPLVLNSGNDVICNRPDLDGTKHRQNAPQNNDVNTVVRPWFGRGMCASHVSASAVAGRAHARSWRTCVPSGPRTDGRGHVFRARQVSLRNDEFLPRAETLEDSEFLSRRNRRESTQTQPQPESATRQPPARHQRAGPSRTSRVDPAASHDNYGSRSRSGRRPRRPAFPPRSNGGNARLGRAGSRRGGRMSSAIQTVATLDDLRRVDGKAELIAGRIVHLVPTGRKPSRVAARIYRSLDDHAETTGRGEAYNDNTGFAVPKLSSGRESFSPDASYYDGALPQDDMDVVPGQPALAVEVRSKGDYGDLAEANMEAKRAEHDSTRAAILRQSRHRAA